MPASRTWRTARSARWAGSRPAPAIMPAGSPSCSPPGRRATGPSAGRCGARRVRELAQGLNFVAVARRPGQPESLPAGRGLWHGLSRRAGLRPRPDARPWRRLSGLRLLSAAAARARRRHLRLRQPHLCRPVAAGLGGGAGAAPRRPARAARGPGQRRAGAVPINRAGDDVARRQPRARPRTCWR